MKGISVVGFDINQTRIDELEQGYDRTLELNELQLTEIKKPILYTSIIEDIQSCNIYIITVPTPIDSSNRPDLTPLIKSSQLIGKVLKKRWYSYIWIYSLSRCYRRNLCPWTWKNIGFEIQYRFLLWFSPERINPGDKKHTVFKIVKVTSGSTPEIAEKVDLLYKSIITAGTYKASSIKVVEASKVLRTPKEM